MHMDFLSPKPFKNLGTQRLICNKRVCLAPYIEGLVLGNIIFFFQSYGNYSTNHLPFIVGLIGN